MSETIEKMQAASVYEIAVIPGEGIGPEVTSVALDVLAACNETLDCQITTSVDSEATTPHEKNLVNNKSRLEFLESAFEKKPQYFMVLPVDVMFTSLGQNLISM